MKEQLQKMNQRIDDHDKNNAQYVAKVLINEINSGNGTLARAEQILREINSRVFLIALPIEIFMNRYDSILPNQIDKMHYALWICMNGKRQAQIQLSKNKISEVDNMVQLHSYGFLCAKNK